ncbi:MAG: sulfatase-like hydrolase/transferase [Rhodoferax sp.]|nr:sulfatase-like hydrolase/transferase [Rhodoferax sp.]
MAYRNVLLLCSDEHDPRHSGFMGSGVVHTPHLDRLAGSGAVFERAYTPSPICVPARASLATGRWVHDHRCWDNAIAYSGAQPSWGHRLQAAGVGVESVGKLHYRSADDDTGFDRQREAVHIADGKGQVWGCVRDPLPERSDGAGLFGQLGAGETEYNRFDRRVAEGAIAWLTTRAQMGPQRRAQQPAMLFAGFVAPHFPLVVPAQYLELYPDAVLPWPKLRPETGYRRHPWVERQARFNQLDAQLGDDRRRRLAIASYLGLVSFVDAQIGRVLAALDAAGLRDETLVIYTSDHGDNLGARGMWNKSLLYRESTAVPLVVSGPGVGQRRVATHASLVDIFPTVLDAFGVAPAPADADLPGRSLLELAAAPEHDRTMFSEYHAVGSASAAFMLAHGRFKYHHYVGYPPELFDLQDDPQEEHDLGGSPDHRDVLRDCKARLRAIVDPQTVDRLAKDDQNAVVERAGGREAALRQGKIGATPVPSASATKG